jgi:hypothetical protein
MRRLVMVPAAMMVMAFLWAAPVHAQTETSVTGAGAGAFPAGTFYLEVPLHALELGMAFTAAGPWATGLFQATLVGASPLGLERSIEVEGIATGSVPSPLGTATLSGTCTVDAGDGAPHLPGVPFTVVVTTNPDGTGSVALTLGTTQLPVATVDEGHMTVS